MTEPDVATLEYARLMDRRDPLREFRSEFDITDTNTIYLDGNSLGRPPLKTLDLLTNVMRNEWGQRLVRGWNENWIERSKDAAEQLSGLIGAAPDEVLVADSTSVNLFKLVITALKSKPERKKIISDALNFPSDLYIIQGIKELLNSGYQIELIPSHDNIRPDLDSFSQVLDSTTAIVTLSLVAFKSAFLYDMNVISEQVHDHDALICWDLSHATGVVPIDLHAADADMAVGCTYKYLNGGPGAPAFLYVKKKLQDKYKSPIWGWFGAENPFSFGLKYTAAAGIDRFAAGTPPILSLTALLPAIEIITRAGIENIRNKSIKQTEYLISLYDLWLKPLGFSLGSPRESDCRGSHVAVRHTEGYRICQALIHPDNDALTVIPDFRSPDSIRLGIAPLYTSFEEIFKAMDRLRTIAAQNSYQRYSADTKGVT